MIRRVGYLVSILFMIRLMAIFSFYSIYGAYLMHMFIIFVFFHKRQDLVKVEWEAFC